NGTVAGYAEVNAAGSGVPNALEAEKEKGSVSVADLLIPDVDKVAVANGTAAAGATVVMQMENLTVAENRVVNATVLDMEPGATVARGNDTVATPVPPNATAALQNEKAKKERIVSEKLGYALVGYAALAVVAFIHAKRSGYLQHPYAQTFRRILVRWVGYVFMGFKFAFFITIELGLFPTFCGVLIDLCTLPMFGPTATVANRLAALEMYPWTWRFLHWLAGTTFMFQFALYVSTIRDIVRPGVLWFIRDPNDQRFHPMNDILERPFLLQLRKLAV
ncbi:hypothetical protein HK104_008001, partial [Borealophlyctis nickersoniae]